MRKNIESPHPVDHASTHGSSLLTAGVQVVMLMVLASCGRSSHALSKLSRIEQVQALVLEDLATEFLHRSSTTQDGFRLFLADRSPRYTDPSPDMVGYVASSFRSARPFGAAALQEDTSVIERDSGRRGAVLWVDLSAVPDASTITIKAGYFVDGKNGQTYAYHLRRTSGDWRIVERTVVSTQRGLLIFDFDWALRLLISHVKSKRRPSIGWREAGIETTGGFDSAGFVLHV